MAEAPRLRLNFGLILLSLHKPLDVAEQIATVDVMSGGKVIFGVALGYRDVEFLAFGTAQKERVRRFEENLEAVRRLWTEDSVDMVASHFILKGASASPRPVQKPHPPIWIGGDADAQLKRAARFASGWIPFLTQPKEFPAKIDVIKSQPTYNGGPFEVCYGLGTSLIGEGHVVIDDPTQQAGMTAPEIIDRLGWFAELGVTMSSVPIPPVKDVNAYLDYAQWVIEEIKPKVP